MPVSTETMARNIFFVMNQSAVDLANHTAVLSVDTDIDVEMVDGEDQYPLQSGDMIWLVDGLGTLEAGIAVVNCKYKDSNTLTLRTTNPSAGAINPASIAANALIFAVARR